MCISSTCPLFAPFNRCIYYLLAAVPVGECNVNLTEHHTFLNASPLDLLRKTLKLPGIIQTKGSSHPFRGVSLPGTHPYSSDDAMLTVQPICSPSCPSWSIMTHAFIYPSILLVDCGLGWQDRSSPTDSTCFTSHLVHPVVSACPQEQGIRSPHDRNILPILASVFIWALRLVHLP